MSCINLTLNKNLFKMDKHLEFIQNIISRMANNSFLIKGWSVTLVAALFALAAKDANESYIMLAYFPAIIFALLDAYYLYQEKLFRDLYNKVRVRENTDYDMSTEEFIKEYKWIGRYLSKLFSVTILLFHLAIIGSIMLVAWFDVILK